MAIRGADVERAATDGARRAVEAIGEALIGGLSREQQQRARAIARERGITVAALLLPEIGKRLADVVLVEPDAPGRVPLKVGAPFRVSKGKEGH